MNSFKFQNDRQREREGEKERERVCVSTIRRKNKQDRRLYYWKTDSKMSKNLCLNLEQVLDIEDKIDQKFCFLNSTRE